MQRLDGRPRRQCTTRVAAAAPRRAQNAGWGELPLALLHACFALLPLDSRLHAAGVCADWRAAAAAQDWTRLSFNGCACKALSNKLLLAAARRAGNAAVVLELPKDIPKYMVRLSRLVLLGVLRANSATLREVRLGDEEYTDAALTEFVKAVPHARVFAANVRFWTTHGRASPMLRNEQPYAALRLHQLALYFDTDYEVPALMAAATTHASLRELKVYSSFSYAPALNAVVDAATSLSLCELSIGVNSFMSAAAVTALPRLLQSEALTALTLRNSRPFGYMGPATLLSPESLAALGAALRTNSTLTALSLESMQLWQMDTSALFAGLQSHPSLRSISFLSMPRLASPAPAAMAAAVGSAMRALVAANAPALESLRLCHCKLGDAGLGPVVAALPRNTHLRIFDIDDNNMSEPFAREHLLPALQACTTVHSICCHTRFHGFGRFDGSGCLNKTKPGIGQELEQLLSPRRPVKAAQ